MYGRRHENAACLRSGRLFVSRFAGSRMALWKEANVATVSGSSEMELQLRSIRRRDVQLWGMTLGVLIASALGLICLLRPSLDGLQQLAVGFAVLMLLFHLHITCEKRRLEQWRARLEHQLVLDSSQSALMLLDPLTRVYSPAFIHEAISKEVIRAERGRYAITFVVAEIQDFARISKRFGAAAAEHLLLTTAELLKKTVRGADLVARNGEREFLLMLPDTTPVQGQQVLRRLEKIIKLRSTPPLPYTLQLALGWASWRPGDKTAQTLEEARKSLAQPARIDSEEAHEDGAQTQAR